MKLPLLSICIPSYGRKNAVERLYNMVILKIINNFDNVEFCFSDNCSDYDIFQIMKPSSNLKIQHQTKNVGFDNNVLSTLKMATGKYVLFMGNDDLINVDGLICLLNLLSSNTKDIVFLNYAVQTDENTKEVFRYKSRSEVTLPWVLKRLNDKITFFASFVIRKELMNIDSVTPYVDKSFIHIALLLDAVSKSHKMSYIEQTVVIAVADKNIEDKKKWNVYNMFIKDLGSIINSNSYKNINVFKNNIFLFVTNYIKISEFDYKQFRVHGFSTFLIRSVFYANKVLKKSEFVCAYLRIVNKIYKIRSQFL